MFREFGPKVAVSCGGRWRLAALVVALLAGGCGGGAPVRPDPVLEAPSPTPSRWRAAITPYVAPLIEHDLTPGLVVGVVDREGTEVLGFGRLSRTDARTPDGRTPFEIGSLSKVFTAILLADAIERGELSLDTPAATSLPDALRPLPGHGEEITVAHLATHRSSLPRIPDNLPGDDLVDPYAGYSFDDLVAFIEEWRFLAAPGERYAYSNLGAGWLGEIVARRAGASYADLLRTRLTGPLALGSTAVDLPPDLEGRLAPPHREGVAVSPWHLGVLAGAGGIRSCGDDLVRFLALHLEEEIATEVEPATLRDGLRAAFEVQVPGMGLGWHLAGDGVTRWHTGQTGGFSSAMFVNRVTGTGVIVLANGASSAVDAAAEKIFQRVCGLEPKPPVIRPSIARTAEQLDRLVGTYDSDLGFAIEVTRNGEALFARLTNQVAIRVHPSSPTRFFYRDIAAELEFTVEGEGMAPASAVTLLQNGREMLCVRRGE